MASLAILETIAIGWDEEPQKRTEKKCVVSSLLLPYRSVLLTVLAETQLLCQSLSSPLRFQDSASF